MNYAKALAEFSCGLESGGFMPECISEKTRPALSAYRNNVRENRVTSLASSYPTVCALVGNEFFEATARVYCERNPSASANLHEDGEPFPAFLASFPPVSDLPYLPDVARLDWALHRSHYAPDVAALPGEALASLPLADFANATPVLHPAMTLVQSWEWPIGSILDYHHGGPLPGGSKGGEAVWVWRDHWQCVTPAEAACLLRWLGGQRIEEGLLAASDVDAEFDSAPLLTQLLGNGLITDIRLGEKHAQVSL
ncbi:MAG: DNA-binding domain-containing protein [Formivibrio sp.]|nr:DNA-binding domain-containing protein [Formivibrio sp.]